MALGCWEDHVERCVDNHVMEKRLLKLYCSLGSCLFFDEQGLTGAGVTVWSAGKPKETQQSWVSAFLEFTF